MQHPLATVTIDKVETFTFPLVPLDSVFLVSNKSRRVWYVRSLKASGANFSIYCNDSNYFIRILSEDCKPKVTVFTISVHTPDEAELYLTVKDKVVYFDRGNKNGLFSLRICFTSRFPRVSQVTDIAHEESLTALLASPVLN